MTNEQEAARYAVERLLRERWSFEVITHQQPDEDAVGSARGLGLALASMGKAVRVVFPTPIPENLDFTEGPHEDGQSDPDVSVLVDVSDSALLGDVEPKGILAVIDHHRGNGPPGSAAWIDPSRSSCAEMVYELVTSLGAEMTPALATNLYMGVFGDTGGFMHANTNREVFRVAYELVCHGADPHAVAYRIKKTRAVAFYRVLCTALCRTIREGRVMASYVTHEDLAECNARPEDASGIVEELASLDGVDLVIFLREVAAGTVKASIRSRVKDAALRTAEAFGGGGHGLAAGCTLSGRPGEIAQRMMEEGLRWVRTA